MVSVKGLLDLLAYGAALLGMIPLYPHLDRPVQAFLPVALLAGVYCDRLGRHPLRGWPVTVLSLLLFSAYALQISADHVVQPVVHMLLVLLAIRLVAAKEGRHYLQIFVLAVFALAGATLLSLSPLFLPALLLLVSCLTAGLVLLTFFQAEPQLRFNGRQLRQVLTATLLLALLSLPLVLLFFLILPRTQHPVWDFLNPQPASIAFAEEVRPGSLVGLAKSGAVAFRAEMEELSAGDLYWRGTVLNMAVGDSWQRRAPPGERERVVGGRPVRQVIYPERETGLGTYLFALDLPQSLAGIAAAQAADLVHTGGRPLDRRAPYQAISHFAGHLQAQSVDRDFYLQLPASAAPRLAAEAERIAVQGGSEREKIARLEAFFRHQELTYATTDLPGAEAPLEEFLFERRRGYCEFFASAFALMLRQAGVPARLVGGYYGGEYNRFGGYYLVAEDTAHVWVEALVDGQQWLRLDPTQLARNGLGSGSRLGRGGQLLDLLDYWWARAVINFDLGEQLALLQGTDRALRQLAGTPSWWGRWWLLLVLAGGAAGWALRRRPPVEERLLRGFLHQVGRRHRLSPLPSVGVLELAEQTADPLCRRFAQTYAAALYHDRRLTGAEIAQLRQLLDQMRKSASRSVDRGKC